MQTEFAQGLEAFLQRYEVLFPGVTGWHIYTSSRPLMGMTIPGAEKLRMDEHLSVLPGMASIRGIVAAPQPLPAEVVQNYELTPLCLPGQVCQCRRRCGCATVLAGFTQQWPVRGLVVCQTCWEQCYKAGTPA